MSESWLNQEYFVLEARPDEDPWATHPHQGKGKLSLHFSRFSQLLSRSHPYDQSTGAYSPTIFSENTKQLDYLLNSHNKLSHFQCTVSKLLSLKTLYQSQIKEGFLKFSKRNL
jgi:hypothetical protein